MFKVGDVAVVGLEHSWAEYTVQLEERMIGLAPNEEAAWRVRRDATWTFVILESKLVPYTFSPKPVVVMREACPRSPTSLHDCGGREIAEKAAVVVEYSLNGTELKLSIVKNRYGSRIGPITIDLDNQQGGIK